MAQTSLAERLAAPGVRALPVLDREVSEVMTPGVISIVESASLARVFRAFAVHRVHALLVVGGSTGRPLGWITARGLLAWIDRDMSFTRARDAITEQAVGVEPTVLARDALAKLLGEQVSRVLVQDRPGRAPHGVVSELDLIASTPR